MGVDSFAFERWAALGSGRHVGSDAALDGIATEPAAGAGREQRILWSAATLWHPDSEDGFGLFRERDRPVLASLAFDPHGAAGAECDVGAVDRDGRDADPEIETPCPRVGGLATRA